MYWDIFESRDKQSNAYVWLDSFMQAHKKSGSAGIFWANAADTYIDISKDKKSTSSHWISEAGLLMYLYF